MSLPKSLEKEALENGWQTCSRRKSTLWMKIRKSMSSKPKTSKKPNSNTRRDSCRGVRTSGPCWPMFRRPSAACWTDGCAWVVSPFWWCGSGCIGSTALIKSDTSLLHCCIDLLPFWWMWFCDVGGWRFHEISCMSLDSTWIFEPWGPGWLIQCAHPPAMGHASALCYPKCWHNKARVQPISIEDIEESTIEMIYMMNRWGRWWISC